jgi:acyl-CoA synthetase (AMP-forming)/AMP-acid ligase II
MEFHVVGQDGDAPPGNQGEIWARGYVIMKSYFNAPQATAEALAPGGWLRTGDVGVLDEAGNLKITDRIKDMFIVGGFNGQPGEVGCAYVICGAGTKPAAAGSIAWRGQVANFKVPRHVEIVTALPLNPSGKVLKYELRERARKAVAG